jgi:hypothetical protein
LDIAKSGSWSTETPTKWEGVGDKDLQCFMRLVKISYALKVRIGALLP